MLSVKGVRGHRERGFSLVINYKKKKKTRLLGVSVCFKFGGRIRSLDSLSLFNKYTVTRISKYYNPQFGEGGETVTS